MKKRTLWFLVIVSLAFIALVFFLVFRPQKAPFEYTTETVKRGDLRQTVEATGLTEPAAEVALRFEIAGTLATKSVTIGQTVNRGDLLAALDNSEAAFRLSEAAGALDQARGGLKKILVGASAEALVVSLKSVEKARGDLAGAEANLDSLQTEAQKNIDTFQATLVKAEHDAAAARQTLLDTAALQKQNLANVINGLNITAEKALADCAVALDEAKKIIDTEDIEIYLGVGDPTLLIKEENQRNLALSHLNTAKALLPLKPTLTNTALDAALTAAIGATEATFTEMTTMFAVLMESITSASFSETKLNTFKTAISNQQSLLANDINALKSAEQNLANARLNHDAQINTATASARTAENAYALAEANLALALAGQNSQLITATNAVNSARAAVAITEAQLAEVSASPRSSDTAAQEGEVKQLTAAYDLALNNYKKTELIAPIAGTVTALNGEIGEQVSPSGPAVVELVDLSGFEIKVDISESDIAKVAVGQIAAIDFDAFGEDYVIEGTVTHIEPAATVIQDVIYYKVTLSLAKNDLLRPGLTANVVIETAKKNSVLYIPRRAVIETNGKKFVKILSGDEVKEIPVTTGLRADDALIEIIDGLEEGQAVITFTKEL